MFNPPIGNPSGLWDTSGLKYVVHNRVNFFTFFLDRVIFYYFVRALSQTDDKNRARRWIELRTDFWKWLWLVYKRGFHHFMLGFVIFGCQSSPLFGSESSFDRLRLPVFWQFLPSILFIKTHILVEGYLSRKDGIWIGSWEIDRSRSSSFHYCRNWSKPSR